MCPGLTHKNAKMTPAEAGALLLFTMKPLQLMGIESKVEP